MTTLTCSHPLAIFGIDDAIIFIILLAIIAVALISIAMDLNKIRKDNNAAEAARVKQRALTDLQTYITSVQTGGSANADQCAEMRRLLDVAISAGVSTFVTGPLKQQIDTLCPGN